MADTWNEELLDAMIRHQIGLLRFDAGVRNRVWKLLDATEADMRAQIANRLRRNVAGEITPANLQRMDALLRGLRETRTGAWSKVNQLMFEEMRALAIAEPAFQAQLMEGIFPVELGLNLPDPARLRAIVAKNAFDGETLKQMLARVKAADIRRIEQSVRIGMTQGESIPEIGRRIVGSVGLRGTNGVTEITRRNAATIARTAVNGVGAAARREFAEANADLAPLQVFIATLDSRTTPVCRKWDGSLHDTETGLATAPPQVKGQPTPVLPLHPGERSLFSFAVDGEVIGERPVRNFTQQGLVREYAEQNGLGKIPGSKRGNLPLGHKGKFDEWARGRMRELTGTVPAKTTYGQFLSRQSAAFQNDILGPTRGKLFRSGGLTLDKFVDKTGAEIPLRDLSKFHADAFRSAGLDPANF